MKCWIGNLDGRRQGLVIAKNQKEAAKIASTSVHIFRQYWHEQDSAHWFTNYKPNKLYTQSYGSLASDAFIEGLCEIKRKP